MQINRALLAILLPAFIALTFPCAAQTVPNPPTNTEVDVTGPYTDSESEKCECGCGYSPQVKVNSISFIQGFGQSPWISGTQMGKLRIYSAVPKKTLGTRAMLAYDHPLSSRVVRRDAGTGEIIVADGLGRETVYDKNGKPKLTAYGRNRQCLLKDGGEVHELLMDRTRIVYDAFNAPVRVVTPDGVETQVADFGIDVVKDTDGIRQIWSRADGLLNITETEPGTVVVSWYPPSAAQGGKDQVTGDYLFSGSPAKTFTFRRTFIPAIQWQQCELCALGYPHFYHPRPGDASTEDVYGLVLEERRGEEFLFKYEWKYIPANGGWTLLKGEGADSVSESLVRPPQIYPGRILQTRTAMSGDGKKASVTRELYSNDYLGYRLLNKTAVNPDGSEQVLYAAARIDQGGNAGRFSAVTNAYGGAESYVYDSDGRMTRETKTVHGGITQVTTNTYASARDADGFIDRRPIRTVVVQDGMVVSDTTYTYRSSFNIFGSPVLGLCDTVTRTDPKTGISLNSYTHYYSATSSNVIERGRVRLTVNPDGTATHYVYAPGENGSWTEMVTQGYFRPAFFNPGSFGGSASAPTDLDQLFGELPGKSTRTVNTHDFRGDVVSTESHVHTGSVFTLAGSETHAYNLMHRRLNTFRHDGTSEMSNWICTGPVWQRNADGTTVTNTFDTAKRISSSTRYTPFGNVTTTNSYNADGQIVSRSTATNGVTVGCGIGCGATYSEYDTQGRTVLAVDSMGRTNRTSYSLDSRTVTHTDPAGAIVIESYGTDGSLLSRTGTVMRAEFYTQGVDAAIGTRWEKTAYGSPTGADYTKSYYNALNQLVLQERPGFGSTTLKTVYAYNTKGQLESETRQVQGGTGTYDLPVTTYAYNQLGDRVATTQSVASVSRIQSSDSAFVVENGIVRQTSVSIQSCSDATIPAMTNAVITRLWPLGEDADWLLAESRQRDVRGNETVQTVTQNPATYGRTTTVSNATSVLPVISVSIAGLTTSSTDQHGCTTVYTYDALGRQALSETLSGPANERRIAHSTHYNALGQVHYTEDTFGTRTVYGYEPATGRRISTTQIGKPTDPVLTTYTAYDSANRTLASWGATYPVAYEYDTAGRMIAMYTYRGTGAIASYSDIAALKPQMDRTQWFYDQTTGLLTNKLYADGKGPSYSYTALGQLSTRKWARTTSTGQQLLTQYIYDNFGSLTNTAYSDGTPSVSFTVDAMGRQKVAQTFLSASGEIVSYTTNSYEGIDLVAEIQNGVRIDRQVDAFGRPKGLAIGQEYAVEYGFDNYGRFDFVRSVNWDDTNDFTYAYLPGSHLLKGYTATKPVSSFEFQVSKSYESNRDLITTVSNTFGTATISAFNYENDGLWRRTARTDTTPTLTVNNAFGYNLKSEVTSATMANGDYNYDYDPIGNRVFSSLNAATNTYSANALNQYTNINPLNPVNPIEEIKPSYDLDGNMVTNGFWSYSWDAENRLTAVYSNDTILVSNIYDHQSRRIAKIISSRGAEAQRRDFIYDAWNLLRERITDNGSLTTNSFTWGLDLSGTLQGAGGVGGLLAVSHNNAVYFPCFDANGNATEYVDSTGSIRAHYAFDAFGNTISQSGDMAEAFSYRFSTTYYDAETVLYYYGCRYYAPELGRWISRDPFEEVYSCSVYMFVDNETIDLIDERGLKQYPEANNAGNNHPGKSSPGKSNPGNRIDPYHKTPPPVPQPPTKGLPPFAPLLPTTAATTGAEGKASLPGLGMDIITYIDSSQQAILKGLGICKSQSANSVVAPPTAETTISEPRKCKCCVIRMFRTSKHPGYPQYDIEGAGVIDKSCKELQDEANSSGSIYARDLVPEFKYIPW